MRDRRGSGREPENTPPSEGGSSGGSATGGARIAAAERQFRRRTRWLRVLVLAVRYTTLGLLVWGVIVLTLRTAFADSSDVLLPVGGLGLLVAVGWAVWRGSRHTVDAAALQALLDHHYGGGGLVMAAAERDTATWQPTLRHAPRPVPRASWRTYRGDVAGCAVAAGFVVASFSMPTEWSEDVVEQRLDLGRQVQTLEDQLDALEEHGGLEDSERQVLRQTLAEVTASADDPAPAFETLDHLQERALWAAAQAAQGALNDGERLAVAQAVTEALQMSSQGAADSQVSSEVRNMLDGMATEGIWPRQGDSAARHSVDPSSESLRADLAAAWADLEDGVEALQAAGLLDPETLRRLREVQDALGDRALTDYLQQQGMTAAQEAVQEALGFGRGGVNRGPGHAPLTVRDSAELEARLQPRALPPGEAWEPELSEILAQRWAVPEANPQAAPSVGGGLDNGQGGAGGAWTHTILPRHRAAVRDFFDRDSPATAIPTAQPEEVP